MQGRPEGRGRERRNRYFEAFEARTLKPETCREHLAEIDAQVAALDADKARLTAQLDRLDSLTSTPDLIAALMADFDKVLASDTTPQKKHLLHRVVKEVRVHEDRRSFLCRADR